MERAAKAVLRRLLPQLPREAVDAATFRNGSLVLPTVTLELGPACVVITGLAVRIQASLRPSVSVDGIDVAFSLSIGADGAPAAELKESSPSATTGGFSAGLQRLERASAGVARLLAVLAQTSSAAVATLTIRVQVLGHSGALFDVVAEGQHLHVGASDGLIHFSVQRFDVKVLLPPAVADASAAGERIMSCCISGGIHTASVLHSSSAVAAAASPSAPALRVDWRPFDATAVESAGGLSEGTGPLRLQVGHITASAALPLLLRAHERLKALSSTRRVALPPLESSAATASERPLPASDGVCAAAASGRIPASDLGASKGGDGPAASLAVHAAKESLDHESRSVTGGEAPSAVPAAPTEAASATVVTPSIAPTSAFSPRGLWRFLDDRIRGAVAALASQPAEWREPGPFEAAARGADAGKASAATGAVTASRAESETSAAAASDGVEHRTAMPQVHSASAALATPTAVDGLATSPSAVMVLGAVELSIAGIEARVSTAASDSDAAAAATAILSIQGCKAEADVSEVSAGRLRLTGTVKAIAVHAIPASPGARGVVDAVAASAPIADAVDAVAASAPIAGSASTLALLHIVETRIALSTGEPQAGAAASAAGSAAAATSTPAPIVTVSASELSLAASSQHLLTATHFLACVRSVLRRDSPQLSSLPVNAAREAPVALCLRVERLCATVTQSIHQLAGSSKVCHEPSPADTVWLLLRKPAQQITISCGPAALAFPDPLREMNDAVAAAAPTYALLQLAARGDALAAAAGELARGTQGSTLVADSVSFGMALSELRVTIPSPAHATSAISTIGALLEAAMPVAAGSQDLLTLISDAAPQTLRGSGAESGSSFEPATMPSTAPTPVPSSAPSAMPITVMLGSAALDLGLAPPAARANASGSRSHTGSGPPASAVEAVRLELSRMLFATSNASSLHQLPRRVVAVGNLALLLRGHRSSSGSDALLALEPQHHSVGSGAGSETGQPAQGVWRVDADFGVRVSLADADGHSAQLTVVDVGRLQVRLQQGIASSLIPPILATVEAVQPAILSLASLAERLQPQPSTETPPAQQEPPGPGSLLRIVAGDVAVAFTAATATGGPVMAAPGSVLPLDANGASSAMLRLQGLSVRVAVPSVSCGVPPSALVIHTSADRMTVGGESGGKHHALPRALEEHAVLAASGVEVRNMAAAAVLPPGNGPSLWLGVPSVTVVIDAANMPALLHAAAKAQEEAVIATLLAASSRQLEDELATASHAAAATSVDPGRLIGGSTSCSSSAAVSADSTHTVLADGPVVNTGVSAVSRTPTATGRATLQPSLATPRASIFSGLGVASFSLAPPAVPQSPTTSLRLSTGTGQGPLADAALAHPLPGAQAGSAFTATAAKLRAGGVSVDSAAAVSSPATAVEVMSSATQAVATGGTGRSAAPVDADWRLSCTGDEAFIGAVEALQQDVNAAAPTLNIAGLHGRSTGGAAERDQPRVRDVCTREAAAHVGTVRLLLRLPPRAGASTRTAAGSGVASITAVDAVAHGIGVSLVEVEQSAGVATVAASSSGSEGSGAAGFEHVALASQLSGDHLLDAYAHAVSASVQAATPAHHVTHLGRSARASDSLLRLHARLEMADIEARITDPDQPSAVGALSRAGIGTSAAAEASKREEELEAGHVTERDALAWLQLELLPGAPARAWLQGAVIPLQLSASPALVSFLQSLPEHPAISALAAAAHEGAAAATPSSSSASSSSSSSSFVEVSSRDAPSLVFKHLALEPWYISLSLADHAARDGGPLPAGTVAGAGSAASAPTAGGSTAATTVYITAGGVAVPLIAFKQMRVGFPPVQLRDVTGASEAAAAVARLYAAHTLSRLTSLASALPSTVMPLAVADVRDQLREHAVNIGAGVSSFATAARAALGAASASLQSAAAAAVAAVSPLAGGAASPSVMQAHPATEASRGARAAAAAAQFDDDAAASTAAFTFPATPAADTLVGSATPADMLAQSSSAADATRTGGPAAAPWDDATVTRTVTSLLGPRFGALPAQVLSSVHAAMSVTARPGDAGAGGSPVVAAGRADAGAAPSLPATVATASAHAGRSRADRAGRVHHDDHGSAAAAKESDDDWQLL